MSASELSTNIPKLEEKSQQNSRFKCSKVVGNNNIPLISSVNCQKIEPKFESKASTSNDYEMLNIPDSMPKIDDEAVITFRYKWSLKIATRLIAPSDLAILHVSPAFCTAFNGVQFTWLIRMCDENLFEIKNDGSESANLVNQQKRVNVTLYYKDGPALDVKLESVNIFIDDSNGKRVFSGMPLEGLEYTKGSGGWFSTVTSSITNNINMAKTPLNLPKFTQFIYANVGKQINVTVQLKIHTRWFLPLNYLSNINNPAELIVENCLEELCRHVLEEIKSGKLIVPDVEFFDLQKDKYALHRHIFLFASREIFEQSPEKINSKISNMELASKIERILAHIYFDEVLADEAECFEDFVAILEATSAVHFPTMKRECERFICREVMLESADLQFAKKTLLLAERYELPILKMVSSGVIVDRLLVKINSDSVNQITNNNNNNVLINDHNNSKISSSSLKADSTTTTTTTTTSTTTTITVAESVEEIREELLQIAEQITTNMEEEWNVNNEYIEDESSDINSEILNSETNEDDNSRSDYRDTLVENIVVQLEELAKHIRKVSMPSGVSPAPVPPCTLRLEGSEIEDQHPPYLHLNNVHLEQHLETGSNQTMKTLNFESRRSSLKTSRNHLISTSPTSFNTTSSNFSFPSQLSNLNHNHNNNNNNNNENNSSENSSPSINSPLFKHRNISHRRSVMFSLPKLETYEYNNLNSSNNNSSEEENLNEEKMNMNYNENQEKEEENFIEKNESNEKQIEEKFYKTIIKMDNDDSQLIIKSMVNSTSTNTVPLIKTKRKSLKSIFRLDKITGNFIFRKSSTNSISSANPLKSSKIHHNKSLSNLPA